MKAVSTIIGVIITLLMLMIAGSLLTMIWFSQLGKRRS